MGWTESRARLAAMRRHHPDRDPTDLRRELRAARLAHTISLTLAQSPPLTADERRALAELLLAGTGAGATA
jgi:hypothetical protein